MPTPLSLVSAFDELPDPRLDRGKEHRLTDLLVIAVCTLLVGGESAYDMEDFGRAREGWLRTFLPLPNGIASHDTFNRLFQVLDPQAFAETFARWTQSLREQLGRGVVALDGKAVRRATAAGRSPRHLVSVWATENGLTLGQLQAAEQSDEITAVPARLRQLELAGCIVTAETPCTARRPSPASSLRPTPTTCWPSRATKPPRTRRSRPIWMTPWPGRPRNWPP
jgi:hypothetical protein